MPMPSWLSGTSLPRPLGWVTAAYSAAIIVRPKVLAAPCGFVDSRGEVQREGATVIAAVGARDVASGAGDGPGPRGQAKTSSAIFLAQRAAEIGGLKVVLVDMNRGQGDIRKFLRLIGAPPALGVRSRAAR
jgi:hypothetical protein